MRRHPVQNINAAIKELREARRFLLLKKFELAEDELADGLTDIAKAIRGINHKEHKRIY